ncbi:hypothetical protein [Nostoc sp. PCC 9305]|uniref:hypothetical protein n=1 Tax=Nostoc sp. PCC 9305 TaxID=296636 RepID=UPI0039C6B976
MPSKRRNLHDDEPFWNGFTAGSRCDRSQNRSPQRLVANTSVINSNGCSQA